MTKLQLRKNSRFVIATLLLLVTVILVSSQSTAAAACTPPLVGDWDIIGDCTLTETQAAPGNVIVHNHSQLTIPSDVTLGAALDDYSIRVAPEGRILVESDGRIHTYRCADVDSEFLDASSVFRYGVSAEQLETNFYDLDDGLAGQGYQPYRLTGYQAGSTVRFATKWIHSAVSNWESDYDLTATEFNQRFADFRDTHRLIDVSGYNTPEGIRFADIWVENTEGFGWWVHPADTLAELQQRISDYAAIERVPVRVESYLDNGQARYISLWVSAECKYHMEPRLTRQEYQDLFDLLAGSFRLVHLDQYTENGNVYYAAIWWQRSLSGTDQTVQSNRDWYLFQRSVNNNWCDGFTLTNFYAAEHPAGAGDVRYGGIWTYHEPVVVGSNASLATKVHQEINCTPGRAGGAIIRVNAVTGAIEDEIGFHEGQVFGTASTIKLALMLEVLRLVDANSQLTLNTLINVGQPYGSTSTPLVPNQSYTLRLLMQTMIANSDNWATNRLVDCLANLIDQNGQVDNNCTNNQDGMAVFNQAMQDLGLTDTRWRRYMRGSGPSPNGSTAYQNGQDNTSTPQEMAALLQMIHNNDDGNGNALLSSTSYNFYWNTMGLDSLPPPPGDGISIKGFIDDHLLEAVGKNWPNFVDIDNKPGGNPWSGQVGDYAHKPQLGSHFQRADAGRLTLDTNGDGFLDSLVFYALFIDEGEMSTPQPPLAGRTFSCIGAHLVREYTGQTSGADLTDPSVVTPTCLSP